MGLIFRNNKMYGNNPNVITMGVGGGFAPIGTVIAYMGATAPQDYLVCDGSIYNIADYPQLANFFETQFGSKNKFGGDGTTTFAVPDLRGEFLRGNGTNSHSGQGNGAGIGTHQDATEIPYVYGYLNSDSTTGQISGRFNPSATNAYNLPSKTDSSNKSSSPVRYVVYQGNTAISGAAIEYSYMTRPTNTSVLYCIKAKVAGTDYSTNEQVIGTWIDGKPLYQRVIVGTLPNCTTEGTVVASNVNHGITNVDLIFIASAFVKDYADWPTTSSMTRILPYTLNSGSQMKVSIGRTQIQYANGAKTMNGSSVYSVAQYTKTTD